MWQQYGWYMWCTEEGGSKTLYMVGKEWFTICFILFIYISKCVSKMGAVGKVYQYRASMLKMVTMLSIERIAVLKFLLAAIFFRPGRLARI
jgi:hypothetical protein